MNLSTPFINRPVTTTLLSVAIAVAVALALGTICCFIAGNSFDLFIGGVFITALLVPPCSAIAGRSPGAWGVVVGICFGVGCSWLMPVHGQLVSLGQWAMCMLVLASFAAVLKSAVGLLMRFSLSPMTASGIITIAGLAWLTWPVWLCSSLTVSHLHWSVLFQPLMAINHVVASLGIWTEQQVAYGLTNFDQDVQYKMPTSAWPVILLQTGLAGIMSLAAGTNSRRAERTIHR